MAEKILILPCPECDSPVEIEPETQVTVCVYCASVVKVFTDEEGDLVGQVETTPLREVQGQEIAHHLNLQAEKIRKIIADKRSRVESVTKSVQEEEKRDISLLPSSAKRNANIAILVGVILMAVLVGNLMNGAANRSDLLGLSIFTVVVFLGILGWMVFTYFSGGRESRVRAIRQNYVQELDQLTSTTVEEIEKLEKRLNLTENQIQRLSKL